MKHGSRTTMALFDLSPLRKTILNVTVKPFERITSNPYNFRRTANIRYY